MARKPRRQKLSPEQIKKRSRRDVAFSKRRKGAFKKADELTTVCGAEVALIFFSPAGNPHSYGSPDVYTIIDRAMMGGGSSGAPNDGARALNEQLTAIQAQLEVERERGEELDKIRRAKEEENRRNWWRPEYSGSLGLPEIERLRKAMEYLKSRTAGQIERARMIESAVQNEYAAVMRMTAPSNNGNFAGGAGPSSAAHPNAVNPPYAAGRPSSDEIEKQLINEAIAIYNSLP